jgi:hypothetical protein
MNRSLIYFRGDAMLWAQACWLLMAGSAVLAFPVRDVYLCTLGVFTLVGAAGLLRCLFQSERITVWDIFLTSLCLGYGLGTLNTELNWIQQASDYITLTTAKPEVIMQTTGLLMLLGALMAVASSLDGHFIFRDVVISAVHRRWVVAAVYAALLAVLAQIAKGTIGFHQDLTDGGTQVSALAVLTISMLCPVIAAGSFVWPQSRGWQRHALTLALTLLLLVQFYQGRRIFIYTLVIALICHFTTSPARQLLAPRRILMLGLSVVLMFGASKAFYALRMAMWEMGSAKDTVALLQRGADILLSSDRSGLEHEVEKNEQSRTFIVGYLAELVQAQAQYDPLYGEVLGFDLAISVPSVLWPGKYRVMAYGAEEAIANPHFGMVVEDQANSIETSGVSDFGLPGMYLYPLLIGALYSLLLRKARGLGDLGYLMVTAALVNNLLNVEIGTSEFIGTLRNIAILLMLAWVMRFVWRSLTSTEPVRAWLPVQARLARLMRALAALRARHAHRLARGNVTP